MSVELVPHLPTELQDHICELAARESLQTAGRLIQVSISVSHRVGPILYEIVIIQHKGLNKGGTYYPPHIEHRSSILDFFQQHGRHIRYLLIDLLASISLIALFLQLCPSLKNLIAPTFQFSTDMIQTIERHLPDLRRLSGKFKYCLAAFDPWKGPFRHLTHLDMVGAYEWSECSQFLPLLRSLTHLALNHPNVHSSLQSVKENKMVLGSLKNCQKLRALLLVSETHKLEGTCRAREYEPTDDRIVVVEIIAVDDWLNGVRDGFDMWALADRIIMGRRFKRRVDRDAD